MLAGLMMQTGTEVWSTITFTCCKWVNCVFGIFFFCSLKIQRLKECYLSQVTLHGSEMFGEADPDVIAL